MRSTRLARKKKHCGFQTLYIILVIRRISMLYTIILRLDLRQNATHTVTIILSITLYIIDSNIIKFQIFLVLPCLNRKIIYTSYSVYFDKLL